jgi:hypothetical protein
MQFLLHFFGIGISLLQFHQLALRLIKLLPGKQLLRLAQSFFQALPPLSRLAILLNLGKQVCGLGIGRVKLQRSLVLAFRDAGISLTHGALPRADRLTNLPQAVALLDSPHLQVAHSLAAGIQFLRFGKNPDRLTKFPLVKGVLTFRQ